MQDATLTLSSTTRSTIQDHGQRCADDRDCLVVDGRGWSLAEAIRRIADDHELMSVRPSTPGPSLVKDLT